MHKLLGLTEEIEKNPEQPGNKVILHEQMAKDDYMIDALETNLETINLKDLALSEISNIAFSEAMAHDNQADPDKATASYENQEMPDLQGDPKLAYENNGGASMAMDNLAQLEQEIQAIIADINSQ